MSYAPRRTATARSASRGTTSYAGGDVTATLEMTIVTDSNLTQGARISDAVLRVARPGGDMIVVPVAGLVGCA